MNVLIFATAVFNLTCAGTETTKSFFGEKAEAYTSVYRIDLEAKKWCEGECKSIFDIDAVQPTAIVLQHLEVDSQSERSLLSNQIDRETGVQKITSTYADPKDRRSIILMTYEGMCEKSAFTGFPKFETKF